MTTTPTPDNPHTDPDRDARHIGPDADRCPECGGYAQRGCGAAWHDGKPDTHCSPACQCHADIRADLRYWHGQATTQEARADKAETEAADAVAAADALRADLSRMAADRDRLAARVETLEGVTGRQLYNAVKRDGRRVLTIPEIQRVLDALAALVAPDTPTSPTDQCPRCHRKVSDHDLATVADACPDPDEAPTARCVDCEHRWIDHGAAGCGFSYCRCTEPRPTSPTDTGDPT